jgi:hypothetical protein
MAEEIARLQTALHQSNAALEDQKRQVAALSAGQAGCDVPIVTGIHTQSRSSPRLVEFCPDLAGTVSFPCTILVIRTELAKVRDANRRGDAEFRKIQGTASVTVRCEPPVHVTPFVGPVVVSPQ